MSINQSRYVRITSGVGGAALTATRELIGRLFTSSVRVAVGEVLEFTSADAVLAHFGPGDEARRAALYFGFVGKTLSRPKRLGFARLAMTAEPPRIFGVKAASLASLKQISAGSLTVNAGADTAALTALDFSAATNYADIATTLQTALRATAGAAFAAASVTYSATSGGFNLTTTVAGPGDISASGDAAGPLGWADADAYSPGAAAQTVGEAIAASLNASDNFGSFAFVPTLTDEQLLEAAEWVASRNVEYIACLRVTETNAASIAAATEGLAGVALTLAPDPNQFDEMIPMLIEASTDYDRRGSAQTYMFQQVGGVTAKVTSDADADTYDALRVNYMGRTQSAGQRLTFYQRGVLQGTITSPLDMNTFANEAWFKSEAQSKIMGLLLSAPRVPANDDGRAQVLAVLQGPINKALNNGTISIGKTLTDAQKSFIGTTSGDPDAWRQVQSLGYWIDAVIADTQDRIDYVLIYSKDDAIREVVGVHNLI